jgi:hypothetical protein
LGEFLGVLIINLLGVDSLPPVILAAEVERQGTALAAGVDQGLRCIEIALGDDALAFEDVGPSARRNPELPTGCRRLRLPPDSARWSRRLVARAVAWGGRPSVPPLD